MKITFLVPPPIDGKVPERVAGCAYLLYYVPNIFLLSAAAVLEKGGYAVKYIREIRGNVSVVFFGPAPSDRPAEFVVDESTYVVRGEPEYTMLDLVKALEAKSNINGIKSVSFRTNDEIIHNANREPIEDLDSLPFPSRHLLEEKDVYYNPKLGMRPFTAVCTSRGCSYRC